MLAYKFVITQTLMYIIFGADMEDISKDQRDKIESFIFPMKSACIQLKNWKGMQPISKRQVLSGKFIFNMDRRIHIEP